MGSPHPPCPHGVLSSIGATTTGVVTSVPWSWPRGRWRHGDGDHHGHRHRHPTAMVGWWWLRWRRSWSPHGDTHGHVIVTVWPWWH